MTTLPPVKGKRPQFTSDPAIDNVLSIVMAVAQELAVLRERCDTYERVLDSKNLLTVDELDKYQPPQSVEIAREKWRQDYLDRILWIMGPKA